MAERFFAKPCKLKSASTFEYDLRINKGVVKDTITSTPVSDDYIVFTYYNDIPVIAEADGATTTYEGGSSEPVWTDLITITDGDSSTGYVTTVDSSAVDMFAVGDYDVIYNTADASGNQADAFTLTITIEDTTAPVITDTVGDTSYVTGTAEPDWTVGVTATDVVDGDLTSSIVVGDTAVDMTTVGEFDVTYDVDDLSGNSATTVTRTITITAT